MKHSLMLLDGLKLCVFKTFYENVYFVVFHAHGMHLWQIQLFECDSRMSLIIHSELLFLPVKTELQSTTFCTPYFGDA